ncbi:MAG: hypothetical protein RMX96_27710 [Nostoc sp. ChiSLP02]|nr:hypothetical protein [Nostoc sp. DedSLP05]MDZ8098354.1 hypothetical protein [Nostoc sp. DedSLP01]MDZ8188628.1 hypothetical protein [Nostoc sp. ChiSLP02]
MANINRVSFKSNHKQKVIIEELRDGELKGIVGGETISYSASNVDNATQIIIEQSIEDKQTGNQRTVTTKTNKTVNGVTEATTNILKFVNGVVQAS